jgi:hypothetical protein
MIKVGAVMKFGQEIRANIDKKDREKQRRQKRTKTKKINREQDKNREIESWQARRQNYYKIFRNTFQ